MAPMRRPVLVVAAAVATCLLLIVGAAGGAYAAPSPAHGAKGKNPAVCSSLPKCTNLCPYLSSLDGCALVDIDELELFTELYHVPFSADVVTEIKPDGSCTQSVILFAPTSVDPTPIRYACSYNQRTGEVTVAALCPDSFIAVQNTCFAFLPEAQITAAALQSVAGPLAGCIFSPAAAGSPQPLEYLERVLCMRASKALDLVAPAKLAGTVVGGAVAGTKAAPSDANAVSDDLIKAWRKTLAAPR